MPTRYFTSESVCAGHPDKIADQISDAIVDAALEQDPHSRVAVETLVTHNRTILAGEVTTTANLKYQEIAIKQIQRLGYTDPRFSYTHESPIDVFIHQQSPEIAQGVNKEDLGAGDQGMMFGYACRETDTFMPLPITLAHELARQMDTVHLPYLRPDGKTQVTIRYEQDQPVAIEHIVLAKPHDEETKLSQLTNDLYEQVVRPTIQKYNLTIHKNQLTVNGTGTWHIGGPSSDTGLTGRKIIVDSYGGYSRVGGGCFSGKDPTKVDRSGAYAARYIAKNIIQHNLADRVEVGLAYCIGHSQPLMKSIETFNTNKVPDKQLQDFTNNLLDTSVTGIIKHLNLTKPQYLPTATYGHFGVEGRGWENYSNMAIAQLSDILCPCV